MAGKEMSHGFNEVNNLVAFKKILESHLRNATRTTSSITDKFESLWKAFNAYMTFFSRKTTFPEMRDWLLTNSSFIQIFNKESATISFRTELIKLKDLTPIYNMRPNSAAYVIINDIRNPKEILDILYQVRCNLIHGWKVIESPRNYEIVKTSVSILSPLVTSIYNVV